jgi:hypothetical protein
MVVLGRCRVRDPVRAVPYANQVFIERACRTRWAIIDNARRFRESRVPRCPEMKLQRPEVHSHPSRAQ